MFSFWGDAVQPKQCLLTALPVYTRSKLMTRPKKITNMVRDTHADSRGAFRLDLWKKMIFVLSCSELPARLMENLPATNEGANPTITYLRVHFYVDKSSYCFSIVSWHTLEKLKSEMGLNESDRDLLLSTYSCWLAKTNCMAKFYVRFLYAFGRILGQIVQFQSVHIKWEALYIPSYSALC